MVAAAKWGTGAQIADPGRERAVLDTVSAGAAQRGLDPRDAVAVFEDQIEANKVVQYGLFSDWGAEPGHVAVPSDLGQVRTALDRLTGELLDALVADRPARADVGCAVALGRSVEAAGHDRHLDALHRRALERAVQSICR